MKAVAFQTATVKPTRVAVPRTAFAKAPLRASRPAQLQSEFLSPVASLKGLCASFSQLVLGSIRSTVTGFRLPLLVEANNKKGLGCTLHGSRKKRARVSGFRARMATPGGRKVLAARRKKGRKNLTPAGMPIRK